MVGWRFPLVRALAFVWGAAVVVEGIDGLDVGGGLAFFAALTKISLNTVRVTGHMLRCVSATSGLVGSSRCRCCG